MFLCLFLIELKGCSLLLLCGVPWCLVGGVGGASVVSTLPSHLWVFSGLSQVCASSRAEGQHSSVPGSVLLLLLSTPRRWMGLMVLRTQQDEAHSCHCNQHHGAASGPCLPHFPPLWHSQFHLFVKSDFLFSPLPCPQSCTGFRTSRPFPVSSRSVFLPFSLVYRLLIKFCRWQFEILVGRVMWLLMLCRSLLHNL